ncbi:hypothetical protein GYA25_00550 [Candidatus Woesearchaeota archaeon]|nr:hypothetical protein [Candidatus Woesearchaeota archaeon]
MGNSIIQDTGNVSIDGSTLFVDANNDRVGIGTTNPGAKLEVFYDMYGETLPTGKIGMASRVYSGAAENVIGLYSMAKVNSASATGYGLYVDTTYGSIDGTRYGVYVNSPKNYFSGNVGIGTTTPGAKLDVSGNGLISGQLGVGGIIPTTGPSVNSSQLLINSIQGTTYNSAVDVIYGGSQTGPLGEVALLAHRNSVWSQVYASGSGSSTDYAFYADGTKPSYFAGNVGIGTTAPSKKLTVEGGSIRPAVGNSADAGIYFPTDPGGGSGDEAFIRYFVESGEATKLRIGINNDADDRLSLYQMGDDRLTIYNGNVGIGTTNPTYKLDVQGTGRFTQALIAGGGRNALYMVTSGAVATACGRITNTVSTSGTCTTVKCDINYYYSCAGTCDSSAPVSCSLTFIGYLV